MQRVFCLHCLLFTDYCSLFTDNYLPKWRTTVEPFQLRYTLSRRQRVTELFPWLPAIAGATGFSLGVAFLAKVVSPWFVLLLLLPIIFYHGLFGLLLELVFYPRKLVELSVTPDELAIVSDGHRQSLPLEGIIQVFRAEGETAWTVLHIGGASLTIPTEAITAEQVKYLKSFALAAKQRRDVERAEHAQAEE